MEDPLAQLGGARKLTIGPNSTPAVPCPPPQPPHWQLLIWFVQKSSGHKRLNMMFHWTRLKIVLGTWLRHAFHLALLPILVYYYNLLHQLRLLSSHLTWPWSFMEISAWMTVFPNCCSCIVSQKWLGFPECAVWLTRTIWWLKCFERQPIMTTLTFNP